MKGQKRNLYTVADEERFFKMDNGNGKKDGQSYYTNYREDVVNLINSLHFRRLENKSQLFPALESDLFRNRLTHTLEVSRIAQDIAVNLNTKELFFKEPGMQIDIDLVNFAAYAHDIGHPPFGHTGEYALDDLMYPFGGFEGNAQTVRIVCRLIRKFKDKNQRMAGINPTYRAIASVLKYDNVISSNIRGNKIEKGYYKSEEEIVNKVKQKVLGGYILKENGDKKEAFRTLECSIMDVADDIAYSTYDVEDAMRSEMLNILDFFYPKQEIIEAVIKDIEHNFKNLENPFFTGDSESKIEEIKKTLQEFAKFILEKQYDENVDSKNLSIKYDDYTIGRRLTDWVAKLISKVEHEPHYECPPLTRVFLNEEYRKKVEILKVFVFQTITLSAPLQAIGYKGQKIVKDLFLAMVDARDKLLPPSERDIFNKLLIDGKKTKKNEGEINRIYCDYIANMTDEFAYSVYKQLLSSELNPTVNILRQY